MTSPPPKGRGLGQDGCHSSQAPHSGDLPGAGGGRRAAEQRGVQLGTFGTSSWLQGGRLFRLPSLRAGSDLWRGVVLSPLDLHCSTGWEAGQFQGAWEPSLPGISRWGLGATLGYHLKADSSCLVAGVLKSKRNDFLSTPLVSLGSIWWFSLGREGLALRGAEKTTGARLPAPHSGLCGSLQLFSLCLALLFPHFPDVCTLYVHYTAPFSTYMYIHICIHISCGSPSFPFFEGTKLMK